MAVSEGWFRMVQRRLAAIVVADVVGYSRLMAADEAGTLERWNQQQESVIEPVVRSSGGRIVKRMGDGLLIEFSSAVNAVKGSLELQQKSAGDHYGRDLTIREAVDIVHGFGRGAQLFQERLGLACVRTLLIGSLTSFCC